MNPVARPPSVPMRGPWRLRLDPQGRLHVVAGPPNAEIIICTLVGYALLDPQTEANAARIVAAVNAVEEIPTSALFNGIVGDMLGTFRLAAKALLRAAAGDGRQPGFWRNGLGGEAYRAVSELLARVREAR